MSRRGESAEARRAVILVLVLVVIAMLALAGLGFCELMLNEHRAALTSGRQAQARALAQSGIELARQFLDREHDDQTEAGGLYDNSQRFSGQVVIDDESPYQRGRFTILAPRLEDRQVSGVRYGLQDESTRINLATILNAEKQSKGASKKMLMGLPGMTDEIADAILDWIDADDTTREQGAEADYYSALAPPYAPRNAPPVTIEELTLVRGVTPQLLFGLDAPRAGGAATTTDGTIDGVDNADGSMDHGWAQYLTLFSAESNRKPDGTPKINLNDKDLKKLSADLEKVLDKPMATYIVAYRQQYKPASAAKPKTGQGDLDLKTKASQNLKSVLDLIGGSVNAHFAGQAKNEYTVLRSPFGQDRAGMEDYLPKLLDNTTVSSGTSIPGRININQASRVVLSCIPGLTPDVVDEILARRVADPVAAPQDQHYETWPLVEGIVPLKTMKTLMPFVTAGGSVYRVQVIGGFDKGSPAVRLEAVLDATKRPTRLLFWKDRSHLPGGFPAEMAAH